MSRNATTLALIDRALVDAELLDAGERAWLNAYHARVRTTLGPHLSPDAKKWPTAATKRI